MKNEELRNAEAGADSPLPSLPSSFFLLHSLAPAIVLLWCWMLHPATVDDAFITYRYAQNWAAGHGLTFNIGATPVEGYTNSLWLATAALVIRLGLDVVAAMPLFGALCAAATCVVVSRTMSRLLPEVSPGWAALPALVLAADPLFSMWAVSGLETPLVALAVTGGLCSVLVRRGRAAWSTPVWFLAAALARPDAILWGLVVGIWCLRVDPRRAILRFAVPFAVIFGSFWTLRWRYFGDFWPNTFHDKTGGQGVLLLMGMRYVAWALIHSPVSLLMLLTLQGLDHSRGELPGKQRPFVGIPAALAAIGAHLLYVISIGGDGFTGDRFLMPALPTISLILGWMLASGGLERLPACAPWRWALILGALTVIAPMVEYDRESHRPRLHGVFGETHEQIRIAQWRWTCVGRWINAHAAPGTRVALNPIGAVGFYAREAFVIDMLGLTDPVIARGPVRSAWLVPGHRKGSGARVMGLDPDIILINNVWLQPQPLREWALFYASEADLHERLNALLETYEFRDFEVPPSEWPEDLPEARPEGVTMLWLSALVKRGFSIH